MPCFSAGPFLSVRVSVPGTVGGMTAGFSEARSGRRGKKKENPADENPAGRRNGIIFANYFLSCWD